MRRTRRMNVRIRKGRDNKTSMHIDGLYGARRSSRRKETIYDVERPAFKIVTCKPSSVYKSFGFCLG